MIKYGELLLKNERIEFYQFKNLLRKLESPAQIIMIGCEVYDIPANVKSLFTEEVRTKTIPFLYFFTKEVKVTKTKLLGLVEIERSLIEANIFRWFTKVV